MSWLKSNWKKLALGTVAAVAVLGAGGVIPVPVAKAVGSFFSVLLGGP